jgi:adenylate cyclase
MSAMEIDFEAEGLLQGAGDERATQARRELLRTLVDDGFTLAELRQAVDENRLALLPLERVLDGEGPRYTQRELVERTGASLELLREARRAIGLPAIGPDERVVGADELELAHNGALLVQAGLGEEAFLELTRVMSQSMGTVAAAFAAIWGEALLQPGDTERDLGLRLADSLRALGPLAGPSLQHMLTLRLREQIGQTVVGEAELQSGRLPGAQPVIVGFVDIVGFTRLGEEIPPDELGAVVHRFEQLVDATVQAPARLVKTIGDAAMIVAPHPQPVLDAVLELVEHAQEDDERLVLRAGVAGGDALPRAGDWYGRPVNLASRLTAFARRGSAVASRDVREAAGPAYAWSAAGRRRFKGVTGEIEVFRVRQPADAADVSR